MKDERFIMQEIFCNVKSILCGLEKRGFYIEIFLFNKWEEVNSSEVYNIMLVFIVMNLELLFII